MSVSRFLLVLVALTTVCAIEVSSQRCGGRKINRKKYLCCEGQAVRVSSRRRSYSACCGSEVINTRRYGCGVNERFDLRDEMCCAGKVTTDGGPLTHECCGDNTFVKNEGKLCCDGNVVNGDPRTQTCCGGELIDKYEERCCGNNENYNFHEQVCCDGEVIDYPNGELEWMCCRRDIISRRDPEVSCCGGRRVFNPLTHSCCGTKTFRKGSSKYACCNETTRYRKKNSECCQDSVVEKGTCAKPTEAGAGGATTTKQVVKATKPATKPKPTTPAPTTQAKTTIPPTTRYVLPPALARWLAQWRRFFSMGFMSAKNN